MRDVDQSHYTGRRIEDVYEYEIELHDTDGDKIGKVVEVNPDFIVVRADTGFLGLGEPRLYFVPRDQVAREDDDDWYLSIDRDDLESRGWTAAPSESRYATDWANGRAQDYDLERTRLVRYEEDLDVRKVAREIGDVTVSKRVIEDTKAVDVPIRREEVRVERRPVRDASATTEIGDDAFTEDRITVPVMKEEVEVRKVARPVEEIEITKTAAEDSRRVDETVRREEFDIDDQTRSR